MDQDDRKEAIEPNLILDSDVRESTSRLCDLVPLSQEPHHLQAGQEVQKIEPAVMSDAQVLSLHQGKNGAQGQAPEEIRNEPEAEVLVSNLLLVTNEAIFIMEVSRVESEPYVEGKDS